MADHPQHSNSIDIIKRVLRVKKLKTHFSLVALASQIYWTRCNSPSSPAFNPDQSWSYIQAWVASDPLALSTHFVKRQHHISPTTNRRTPVILFNTIRQQDIYAQYTAHGWFWLTGQTLHKIFNTNRIFWLWSPSFSSHTCNASKSIPLGPTLPECFCITDSTTSSIISMGIKTGVASYASKVIPRRFPPVDVFPSIHPQH